RRRMRSRPCLIRPDGFRGGFPSPAAPPTTSAWRPGAGGAPGRGRKTLADRSTTKSVTLWYFSWLCRPFRLTQPIDLFRLSRIPRGIWWFLLDIPHTDSRYYYPGAKVGQPVQADGVGLSGWTA